MRQFGAVPKQLEMELVVKSTLNPNHPGVELRANLRSISHMCHLFEMAFVWELT